MRLLAFMLLVLAAAALSVAAQRLPRTVVPHHYDLTFAPDFAGERFDGDATIHVTVGVPVDEIVLHAVDLEIHEAVVTTAGETQSAAVALEPRNEWARLRVGRRLQPGPATIRIRYRGVLNRNLRGLYLGEANGKKYASTQMESTDAREAFPSFDEPSFKATFAITAVVDEGHTAISNGAVLSDEPGPVAGKHTIRFATTPRMTTYLVALTAGDFRCARGEADGIPLGICGTPDRMPLADYAMDATKFIVPWYNEYYGIRYPFGKLDQTGVADFRWGAMENSGAILYRDVLLFLDAPRATVAEKRDVSGVISHEIAHMWFGDLVTMRWWDDIWLNEGFATWISAKPLAAWQPEWKIPLYEVFLSGEAMKADSLQSSRKIRHAATTPAEIDELFDGIAYGKTAAVLRMIESTIGEEAMRRGVSEYLATHSWGNTTYHDFSESISRASDMPVGDVLRTFVEQPGVPVLRVTSSCDGGRTKLAVEQQRFYSSPTARGSAQTWAVPLCYRSGGVRRCVVLREAKETVTIDGCGPLVLNADGRGYYVVERSAEMSEAALASLGSMAPAERLVLLRDEWNLVRAGRRTVDRYLRLAEAFRGEPEPLVATYLLDTFETIRREIVAEADRPAFEAWVRGYLQPLAKELGWTPAAGESEERRGFRAKVLYTLGYTGRDESVLRQARRLIDRERGTPTLDPELRSSVIFLAATGGDAKLYESYLERRRKAATPADHNRFLVALAFFPDPALLRRTMELALSDDVKTQDAGNVLATAVAENRSGPEGAWAFLERNWARVEKKLPEPMLPSVLASADRFCDRASLERVRAFYAAHPVAFAARRTEQAAERIQQCVALHDLQSTSLHGFLAAAP